jgi:hypothetical protein
MFQNPAEALFALNTAFGGRCEIDIENIVVDAPASMRSFGVVMFLPLPTNIVEFEGVINVVGGNSL